MLIFMVFNSIGKTPEKLKNPSWVRSRNHLFSRRFETAVPGVVTGYDPRHFLKVQRKWPIAKKNFARMEKALDREL
ncbi:hypothetical protein [Pseudomonas sp. NPDC086278]|uniref:hypothetical protein n=1 Tax=Pseudomonas sp. NPDC086278 TaxID=3390646 RepID=UPI003D01AF7B